MILAIPYDDGQIFQHFGHTEYFRLYEIREGYVVNAETVPTNCSGHGALPQFLLAHKVDAVICGGMGSGMVNALRSALITVFPGASGDCDEAVVKFLSGTLRPSYAASCNHHSSEHSCGTGEHNCGGGCSSCGNH